MSSYSSAFISLILFNLVIVVNPVWACVHGFDKDTVTSSGYLEVLEKDGRFFLSRAEFLRGRVNGNSGVKLYIVPIEAGVTAYALSDEERQVLDGIKSAGELVVSAQGLEPVADSEGEQSVSDVETTYSIGDSEVVIFEYVDPSESLYSELRDRFGWVHRGIAHENHMNKLLSQSFTFGYKVVAAEVKPKGGERTVDADLAIGVLFVHQIFGSSPLEYLEGVINNKALEWAIARDSISSFHIKGARASALSEVFKGAQSLTYLDDRHADVSDAKFTHIRSVDIEGAMRHGDAKVVRTDTRARFDFDGSPVQFYYFDIAPKVYTGVEGLTLYRTTIQ